MNGSPSPLLSVITIVRNNEDLLPRALKSVLNQTQIDLELVVINDGSNDNTGKVIDAYQSTDDRVKPIHLPSNLGRSAARNKGLDASRGKYITFLDADDYLPETAVFDMVTTAKHHSSDIVFGRIQPFDSKTGAWIKDHYTDIFMSTERHGIGVNQYPEILHNHAIVGRCYRRDFLNEHNIRFSTIRRNAEDVTFSFYTQFYAQNISILPDNTFYYYSAGNFFSTANQSKVEDARDSIIETLYFTIEHAKDNVIEVMQKKAAIFAGNLGRAKEVFGMTDNLRRYLPSLVPLVGQAPENLIDTLPPYYQRFARALRAFDFDRAYYLFENKSRLNCDAPIRKTLHDGSAPYDRASVRIQKFVAHNQLLAGELNAYYNSKSWIITAPLRIAISLLRRLKGKFG